MLGHYAKRSASSVALVAGAGFTMGIIVIYLWKKAGNFLCPVRANDT